MKLIRVLLILTVFLFLVLGAQRLLTPKYMESAYDGALIGEYYAEDKNHDIIFIGDCEVYENFSPVTLWDEYGWASYIRGGPQQLIWHSSYLLEDTLRYETPKAVVFSVLAMQYGQPQREAYNRMNLDGMRLSAVKLNGVKASMTCGETAASYVFPLLRFHERWSDLKAEDFRWFFKREKVGHNGYLMRNEVKPAGFIPDDDKPESYEFAAVCFEYLEKMADLCEAKGIELLLIKAPSLYPVWHEPWEAQIEEFAAARGLEYLNILEDLDATGLDFALDSADAGLHFNQSGAEKLTVYLGRKLEELYPGLLQDRRGDAALAESWAKKRAAYDAMSQKQRTEWAETGKILTHTYPQ